MAYDDAPLEVDQPDPSPTPGDMIDPGWSNDPLWSLSPTAHDDPERFRTVATEHLKRALTTLRRLPSSIAGLRFEHGTPEHHRRLGAVVLGTASLLIIGLALGLTLGLSSNSPSAPAATHPHDHHIRSGLRTAPSSTEAHHGASWRVAAEFTGSAHALNAVTCPTPMTCFAVGESSLLTGFVLATNNAGVSWTQQNVPGGVGSLNAISCTTQLQCMAVGGHTVLLTDNGGASWTAEPLGAGNLAGVACPTSTECVVIGVGATTAAGCPAGISYTTRDGGHTWTGTLLDCFAPAALTCLTAAKCELVGTQTSGATTDGEIFGTTTGGNSWLKQFIQSGSGNTLSAISCPSGLECKAVGSSPNQAVVATGDSGLTWVAQNRPEPVMPPQYLSVSCESVLVCYATGVGRPIGTDDGGSHWAQFSSPSTVSRITGAACPEVAYCVGVGDDAGGGASALILSG